jgi:hypothetical protein
MQVLLQDIRYALRQFTNNQDLANLSLAGPLRSMGRGPAGFY